LIRKTLLLGTVLSLLLNLGLWALSWFVAIDWVASPSGPWFGVNRGLLLVLVTGLPAQSPLPLGYAQWEVGTMQWEPRKTITIRAGWKVSYNDKSPFSPWQPRYFNDWPSKLSVLVPMWMPAVLLILLTWLTGAPIYRRRRRRKLGLCLGCGYDLRGQKNQNCPECGLQFDISEMVTS